MMTVEKPSDLDELATSNSRALDETMKASGRPRPLRTPSIQQQIDDRCTLNTGHALDAKSIATKPSCLSFEAHLYHGGISGTGNSIVRRMRDPNFISRYFVGDGIDIGCQAHNTLGNYAEFFPLMRSTMMWDMVPDGDAMYMASIADESFDFVHSSHCLEHIAGPIIAIRNWWRILKPGGHLVVIVPDEDMYEQGTWPSQFNSDHKFSFTTYKARSWSPASVNVFDLLACLDQADIIKVERLTSTFRYQIGKQDQSGSNVGEPAIEFIVHKTGKYTMPRRHTAKSHD